MQGAGLTESRRALGRFTLGLEELVTYLVQQMHKTAITRLLGLLGLSWRAVGSIIGRIADEVSTPLSQDDFMIVSGHFTDGEGRLITAWE